MLICTYVYDIAILAPIILYLISVVGDYKRFNNFPKEIMSHHIKHVLL